MSVNTLMLSTSNIVQLWFLLLWAKFGFKFAECRGISDIFRKWIPLANNKGQEWRSIWLSVTMETSARLRRAYCGACGWWIRCVRYSGERPFSISKNWMRRCLRLLYAASVSQVQVSHESVYATKFGSTSYNSSRFMLDSFDAIF